jgi:hypothetical protein
MNRTPISAIATPATLRRASWFSNRNEPSAVALSPSRMKTAEKVTTNRRLLAITLGSRRRALFPGASPVTAAR